MRKVEFNKSKDKILKVICSDCKRETRHKVLQSVDMTGREDYSDDFWIAWDSIYQIIECQGCLSVSFRTESYNSEDYDPYTGKPVVFERLYPYRSSDTLNIKEFHNIPVNLNRIYREVIDCYNNEINTLCAAGLRTIIEGICAVLKINNGPVKITKKDGSVKVVRKKNLQGKISGLTEKGILTTKYSDILHEHRYLGNEAVHELSQPSRQELALAIEIIENILENVFEIPEKAEELKRRRFKRLKKHNSVK